MSTLFINTDGGARGNPGPAAIGVVVFDADHNVLYTHKECIGVATNNQAEYKAIIKALHIILKSKWQQEYNHDAKVVCRLDSKLVVEQINGNFKVKNEDIKNYIEQIKKILSDINKPIEFIHIPRELNKEADKLVNRALDEANRI